MAEREFGGETDAGPASRLAPTTAFRDSASGDAGENVAAARLIESLGRRREPLVVSRLHLGAVIATTIAYIVHMGATFDMFVPAATRIAIAIEYGILAIYLGIAAFRGQIRVAAIIVAFLGYLIWQTYWFGMVSGLTPNVFSAATFGTVSLVLIFYLSRLPVTTILTTLAICCGVYLLYYIATQPIVANYQGLEEARGVLRADGIREARAYLSGQCAAFILYLGVAMLPRRRVWAVILMALALWAIYLSGSRLFQATTSVVLLSALLNTFVPATRRPTAWALMAVFVACALFGLWGYLASGFNPYDLFFDDPSGRARVLQFQDAKPIVAQHPFAGVGIAASVADLQYFVRPRQPFFYSDLGIAGLVFVFGFPFAILFLIVAAATMLCIPNARERRSPLAMALFWTNQGSVLGSFFTLASFGASGTMFFAVTVLLWLRGGFFEPILSGGSGPLRLAGPQATNARR